MTGAAAACVADRRAQGKTSIETLSGRTTSGRPIMTTGTFVLDDTLISLSEALSGMMKDFSPFGPAKSSARSQQTMDLILGRYETLAKDDKVGEVVCSFMTHLGPTLKDQLAEAAGKAVAGEQVAGSAPWYKRALGAVRSGAGKLTTGALKLAGGVLEFGWVQDLCAGAANTFGKLPLRQIYKFTTSVSNGIDTFFESLDQKLGKVPGYATVKGVVKGAVDRLREMLRVPIEAAVGFVGEAIQKAFAEARVSNTNIAQQIKKAKAAQIANPLLKQYLDGKTPEQQIAMLNDPVWVKQLRLDPAKPEFKEAKELLERLIALESLPDYVKFGPSHSQIAKDHADSPFFGAASTMAAHLDTQLRNRMIEVWRSEGRNGQSDPKLQENYSEQIPPEIQARRAPPGTPLDQMTEDQREAERTAAEKSKNYAEIRRLEEGRRMLAKGGIPEAEESKGVLTAVHTAHETFGNIADQALAFPRRLRSLADQLEGFAPARARELRALAGSLGKGVDGLADEVHRLETWGTPEEAEKLAERIHALAKEKEGLVAKAESLLKQAADEVEKSDRSLDALASALRTASVDVGPATETLAKHMHTIEHAIKDHLVTELAGKEQKAGIAAIDAAGGVKTQEWDPELSKSTGRVTTTKGEISGARKDLFGYVSEVFGHPWDSTWWEQPLLGWAKGNQARLEGYIHDVNTGQMHHTHKH